MLYTSTRDSKLHISSAQAITKGISDEGGLFLPEEIPEISLDFIAQLAKKTYIERAVDVLSLFLTDFTADELRAYAEGAYGGDKFSSEKKAPVVSLGDGVNILELWKGPTCAFKDMALQILPYLLTGSAKKIDNDKEIVILVATSGDTGKAALEGFKDVEGTRILVFYPSEGVSPMQKLQMTTQEGSNVGVAAIRGNFDDAQNGVKAIFTDAKIKQKFSEHGFAFSSANSINWGRLVPQIVYYFSAYCDVLNNGDIALGDKINFVVPTGNFGNILAAYFAMKMGLPVNKLICASNANNVLTDFIESGTYDRNRHFYATCSPSMDILISSNLERLLFMLCGRDDSTIREWFSGLAAEGKYTVSAQVKSAIDEVFAAGCCDDRETKATIKKIFAQSNYLCDTHTAVAVNVYEKYKAASGDTTPTVIDSTASPFKFAASVLEAVAEDITAKDEFSMLAELEAFTGCKAPAQLSSLKDKAVRFDTVCNKEEMTDIVLSMLGIQ